MENTRCRRTETPSYGDKNEVNKIKLQRKFNGLNRCLDKLPMNQRIDEYQKAQKGSKRHTGRHTRKTTNDQIEEAAISHGRIVGIAVNKRNAMQTQWPDNDNAVLNHDNKCLHSFFHSLAFLAFNARTRLLTIESCFERMSSTGNMLRDTKTFSSKLPSAPTSGHAHC